MLVNSAFFGVAISLLSYFLGDWLHKKFRFALLNPLLIAIAATILVLAVARIEYTAYYQSAKVIGFFLTPVTVCLAVPLYETLALLKKNKKALALGIFSGVVTTLMTILAMSLLFGLSHKEYVTFLPKSITSAIGMGVSEELGGYPGLTVAIIIITGVIGNVCAPLLCRLFHLESPIARGVAIGSSSHAIGTVKAMEMGAVEGAISSLSIVVSGLMTVVCAPLFARLL